MRNSHISYPSYELLIVCQVDRGVLKTSKIYSFALSVFSYFLNYLYFEERVKCFLQYVIRVLAETIIQGESLTSINSNRRFLRSKEVFFSLPSFPIRLKKKDIAVWSFHKALVPNCIFNSNVTNRIRYKVTCTA